MRWWHHHSSKNIRFVFVEILLVCSSSPQCLHLNHVGITIVTAFSTDPTPTRIRPRAAVPRPTHRSNNEIQRRRLLPPCLASKSGESYGVSYVEQSNGGDDGVCDDGGDVRVFLSRFGEITATVVDATAPLLFAAIRTKMRADEEESQDAVSGADGKDDRTDVWDDFWSSSSSSSGTAQSSATAAVSMSNAERVVSAIEKLGPTYVKFGQALASRPDIIPPSLANALSTLQDDMVSFSTSTAKAIVHTELCRDALVDTDTVANLIHSLSQQPIAAASVGQVYKGYVQGIGSVAVKVQRPGIRELVR